MIKLNSFHLKLIALVAMVIDHIAYLLIPTSEPAYYIMRIVGRIAAPLFWFCFVEGYKHTSQKRKYAIRLGVAAMVMAVGNIIIDSFVNSSTNVSWLFPNMFATMFLMFVALEYLEMARVEREHTWKRVGCVLIAAFICVWAGQYAEYGWIAVCSILCFRFVNKGKTLVFILLSIVLCIAKQSFLQIFMVLAVLPLNMYVDEKPRKNMKWLFYCFYPMHFWLLMVLAKFV